MDSESAGSCENKKRIAYCSVCVLEFVSLMTLGFDLNVTFSAANPTSEALSGRLESNAKS